MKLELTEAARTDLRDIYRYTERTWNRKQADSYVRALWQRFQAIVASPGRFRCKDELFPGCRIAPQGTHLILFWVDGDRLVVVRILHGASDYGRHIPPDMLSS